MSVLFDNPVQPILTIPVGPVHWNRSESISDPAARWRIYLHQLASEAIMSCFQAEFTQAVLPWPHAEPLDCWHFVDGLTLTLGHSRIVIMLSEALDAAELTVPQEWVDFPGLSADYYLAAYMDVDAQQLVLWGYTTYGQLKAEGTYDISDRTYCLKDTDLTQDFSAFWVAQHLNQPTSSPSNEIFHLSTAQAERLVSSLVKSPEPRLALPFEQWGTLFSSDHWRQQLYYQRHNNLPVSIDDWLEQIFEQGWQSLKIVGSNLPQTVVSKLRSVTNETAVLTCGKKISLNTAEESLLLMFSVDIETNKHRNIRIQLYPSSNAILPNNIMLALELSDTGEVLKSVKAGPHDAYIQIPPFSCSAGQRLRVHIQLADSVCQEEFIS